MIQLEARKTNCFTYSYSQPTEYHFCLDSVILAELVADRVKDKITKDSKVLDLCAGCGVVGFELSHHLPELKQLDFVELQTEFAPHFEKNLALTNQSAENFCFINSDLRELRDREYDLIVCNPPYFEPLKGKLGLSTLKNRCHFFLDCTIVDIAHACVRNLASGGESYFLAKNRQVEHLTAAGSFNFEVIATIRGTNVLCLHE